MAEDKKQEKTESEILKDMLFSEDLAERFKVLDKLAEARSKENAAKEAEEKTKEELAKRDKQIQELRDTNSKLVARIPVDIEKRDSLGGKMITENKPISLDSFIEQARAEK